MFASCGVDQHIRVWDARTQREGISVKAHEADINVISWNSKVSYLMISGCDDGSFKIWDLRNIKQYGLLKFYFLKYCGRNTASSQCL